MTKQQLNILQGKYKPQFLLTWKNEFKTKIDIEVKAKTIKLLKNKTKKISTVLIKTNIDRQ